MIALRDALAFALIIVSLAGASRWLAHNHDLWPGFNSSLNAGGDECSSLRRISVKRVDWSADGRWLLAQSTGGENCARFLTLHASDQKTAPLPIDVLAEPIGTAALASDARHVLVGTCHGQLCWIDLKTRAVATLIELPRRTWFRAVAVADGGRMVAAGDCTGGIYLCNPVCGTSVLLSDDGEKAAIDLRFSREGDQLVSAQADGSISAWDVAKGRIAREFNGHAGPVSGAAFLPGDRHIISAGVDGTVRVWDIASGQEQWCGEFGRLGARALAVSTDGTTAACGGIDHDIVVWDLEPVRKRFEIISPASIIFHLEFSPDGKTLAAAGNEGTIRRYDPRTGDEEWPEMRLESGRAEITP